MPFLQQLSNGNTAGTFSVIVGEIMIVWIERDSSKLFMMSKSVFVVIWRFVHIGNPFCALHANITCYHNYCNTSLMMTNGAFRGQISEKQGYSIGFERGYSNAPCDCCVFHRPDTCNSFPGARSHALPQHLRF